MKQLFIIGSGPGDLAHLTPAARAAIEASDELVGYGLFLKLLGELTHGKNCHKSPMGKEINRVRMALDLAASGRTTSLISSGDAGIYGLATLVFELLERQPQPGWDEVAIEVIPGVSAMQAAAARVGAPLAHDFCVISLSDLLTPWELIERRVQAAGMGDFAVAFYNPASRERDWQLQRARDVLLEYRSPDTPAVIAGNVSRGGEEIVLTRLAELGTKAMNMLTLVLVGNSETRRLGEWIYTPRGYHRKPELREE